MENQKFIELLKKMIKNSHLGQVTGKCSFNTPVYEWAANCPHSFPTESFLSIKSREITFETENEVLIGNLKIFPEMASTKRGENKNDGYDCFFHITLHQCNISIVIKTGTIFPYLNRFGEFVAYHHPLP